MSLILVSQSQAPATPRFTFDQRSDTPLPSWLGTVGTSFTIDATDPNTGTSLTTFSPPLELRYALSPTERVALDGDLSRLKLAFERDGTWIAAPCSVGPDDILSCTLSHLSRFALIAVQPASGPLDADTAGGHTFRQANGFDGAGDRGFA